MAQDHRRPVEEVVQGVLLDDPGFLKEIVERVLQQLLEAEMTEHIRRPLRASRGTHRPPQRPQAEGFAHQGGHAEPARSARA
jgi:transposase-like protein